MDRDASDSSDGRLTRLEVEFEHVRRDLDEIRAGQHRIAEVQGRTLEGIADLRVELAKRPTVAGLWGMVATVIGVSVAMVGIVIAVIALYGP